MALYKFANNKVYFHSSARYKDEKKGINDFHNVIFTEAFAKIIGKKARTRFLLYTVWENFPLLHPPLRMFTSLSQDLITDPSNLLGFPYCLRLTLYKPG